MLDFIVNQSLRPQDFHQKIEYLIDAFIPKHMITMIYADGGMGKSWLTAGIAKYAANAGVDVIYLDFDNPVRAISSRGLEQKLIQPYANLYYVQRARTTMLPMEILGELQSKGSAADLKNTLVIVDSLRNLCNINHDAQAQEIMTILMNIRDSGATILALSHSNKDGRNYQGSNNIRNSLDNMYRLEKKGGSEVDMEFLLTARKDRGNITDQALRLNLDTLEMTPMDLQEARLDDEEKDFIEQVTAALSEKSKLNKTELLDACGYKKDDKTARQRLDKFNRVYWKSSKAKGAITYKLV